MGGVLPGLFLLFFLFSALLFGFSAAGEGLDSSFIGEPWVIVLLVGLFCWLRCGFVGFFVPVFRLLVPGVLFLSGLDVF